MENDQELNDNNQSEQTVEKVPEASAGHSEACPIKKETSDTIKEPSESNQEAAELIDIAEAPGVTKETDEELEQQAQKVEEILKTSEDEEEVKVEKEPKDESEPAEERPSDSKPTGTSENEAKVTIVEAIKGEEKSSQTPFCIYENPTTTTNTISNNETQEVSSTRNDDVQQPQQRTTRPSSARRPSYNSGRGYAGGAYQNYGLTYLPYKSNFEPSEEARRRADEFVKTLKL